MELSNLLLLSAVAGYGDVREDGVPTANDRAIVLWTNAARVAPDAFGIDYTAGGCSTDDFSEDELTAKPPLYIDLDLTDAAIYHSEDMSENGCFQHESCDGTDTWERIARFYTDSAGAMGENIAMGYPDARNAVLSGWMCSHDGHRANIMSGGFNEMGGGQIGNYYTQDFASGELKEGDPPVRMAIEDSTSRSFTDGTDIGHGWYADWGDDDAPAVIEVVRDGIETPMTLLVGEPEQGLYVADEPVAGEDACHQWYISWETAGGEKGTFPGEGSFLEGECDAYALDWVQGQLPKGGLFGDVPEQKLKEMMLADLDLVGCSTAPRSAGWLGLVALGFLMGRRRA